MTVQNRYEPTDTENNHRYKMDLQLSAQASWIFLTNDFQTRKSFYSQFKLQILAYRILAYNARFISDKYNFLLEKIIKFKLRASQ